MRDLRLRVDASPRPVAHAVADDLGQMPHEFVVVFELVALDADDRAVVCHAQQEVAAIGVEESGNGLQCRVRDAFVVPPVFFEAPAQSGLELQGF